MSGALYSGSETPSARVLQQLSSLSTQIALHSDNTVDDLDTALPITRNIP